MKKRFFVLLLCLAAALGIFAAAAENVDAVVNQYTFYVDGAEYITAVLLTGDSLSQPENPEKADHRFAGWYADDTLTTPYTGFGTPITADGSQTDLYAKFEAVLYLTYLDDTGKVILTEEIASGSDYTFSAAYPAFQPQSNKKVNSGWKDQNGAAHAADTVPITESLTLTPVLIDGYHIRFFTQGGSFVPFQFVAPGSTATRPADPTRQGYAFAGWYTAAEGGELFDFSFAPTGGTDLYAHWTPATAPYTLVFMLQNADDDNYTYHSSYQKTGRTGQSIVLDTNDKQYAKLIVQGTNIETCFLSETKPPQLPVINADGSSVAYVYCDRIYYSFKNSGNGKQVDKIRWGQDLRRVMRTLGFDFSYFDPVHGKTLFSQQLGTAYTFNPNDTMPPDDGYYNPDGTYRMYNIENFVTLGRTYGKIGKNEQFPRGKVFVLEKRDYGGSNIYVFKYYRESCDSPDQNGNKVYIDYSFTRYWAPNPYRGALPGDSTSFKYDRAEGVQLVGNNKYESLINNGTIPMEFYFDRQKYDIVFIENDDDLGPDANAIQDVFFNKPLDGMAPNDYVENQTKVTKLDGITYLFSGWYTDPAAKMEKVDFSSAKMPDHDLTLYAAWKPVQSTVTFDPNGGTLTDVSSVTLPTGSQVAHPTDPLWADDTHVFLGWTRDGYPYDFSSPVDQNFVLVAQWGSSTTYQVTYDPGRGSGAQITDSNQYLAGSAAVASAFPPSMTPPGQEHFVYWQDVGGQAYLPGQTVPVNGNVTLTAVYQPWTENKFNITFNPNGGTLNGSANPVTTAHDYDEGITIREMPEREGYRFLGWDDGIKPEPYYQPNETFTVKGHHTFIAKWIELMDLNGEKIWVDGGKSHDNSAEVQLTLKRRTVEPGTEETVAAIPAWNDGAYAYTGLDKTDAAGNPYTYTVTETPVEGYDTTQDGYNITNTITEINRTTEITGTKTWVDGGKTHENENEVQLILTRTSAKASSEAETVNVTPTWSGKTYTYADLPQYDAEGYVYTYTVAEKTMDGYDTVQNGNDFINTQVTPTRNPYQYKFSFTKKWQGDAEDSINWTFYNPDGTERSKKFDKKIISETEWYYEGWFASEADYYLVEKVPEGYNVRYENVGKHAGETDRCYNGGTIINYKVPKTGDDANPALWIALAALGIGGLALLLKKRRASAR